MPAVGWDRMPVLGIAAWQEVEHLHGTTAARADGHSHHRRHLPPPTVRANTSRHTPGGGGGGGRSTQPSPLRAVPLRVSLPTNQANVSAGVGVACPPTARILLRRRRPQRVLLLLPPLAPPNPRPPGWRGSSLRFAATFLRCTQLRCTARPLLTRLSALRCGAPSVVSRTPGGGVAWRRGGKAASSKRSAPIEVRTCRSTPAVAAAHAVTAFKK